MTAPIKDYSFGVVPVRRAEEGVVYLLIQHRAGHWAFPKGHAEAGETPLQTALRELREETGIREVEIREQHVFTEHYDTVKRGRDIDKTVTYYLGWVRDSRVTAQAEEVRDYAWLNFDDASRRITYEETRRVLREAARAAAAEGPTAK